MARGRFITCESESKAALVRVLEECFTDPCTGVPTRCTAVSSNDSSFDAKAAQKNELTRGHSSSNYSKSVLFLTI